ncbi:MAG: phosphotransferase [Pirellulales bacterium]
MDIAEIPPVLAEYPADCQPTQVEPLESAGGFSGARLWRLQTGRGPLCLRRWPREHPTRERLEFMQAVLWHVWQEGFRLVPVPVETNRHRGYVLHAGHFWELTPWMPGAADYLAQPDPRKLKAALMALAQFHRASASFPLPDPGPRVSPGIQERRQLADELTNGGLDQIAAAVAGRPVVELENAACHWLALASRSLELIRPSLAAAERVRVLTQPCLRDIWSDHVLFIGERVTGLIDFGAMRAETVAADIARLLGSLARDDLADWRLGLAAYEAVRPLSDNERQLIAAFDRGNVVLAAANWLRWIYLEHRCFPDLLAIRRRIEDSVRRMAALKVN